MSLVITVPDEIARSAEEIARASGISAEQVLLQALAAHFPPVPAELSEEFDAWNLASDQDFLIGSGPNPEVSLEEQERLLDELAKKHAHLPPLPADAFTRESIS